MGTPRSLRIIILANTLKKPVCDALEKIRPWLSERARIVAEPDIINFEADAISELPEADLALVLGGDGTILAQARNLIHLGLPMLGVNFGKIGFLAEFHIEDLHRYWDIIAAGTCPTSQRLMIEVLVFDAEAADCRVNRLDMDHCRVETLGMNDAVIAAGTPFRMIELDLAIDPAPTGTSPTRFSGDGVIISTPTGSTAHNLAAGGPIISPGTEVLCITPNCPHGLAFRPIIVSAKSVIAVRVNSANPGSALVIDGQTSVKLEVNDQIYVRRYPKQIRLLENPALNYWKMLAKKMHWAIGPRRV